jgi:VIT1/CCC1 family predicted Fe2+/Mn2+ transporter
MVTKATLERYRINLAAERESATLYRLLAQAEQEPHLAEVYRRMAEIEQRHSAIWEEHLRQAGETVSPYQPGWRLRTFGWLARRFGTGAILPLLAAQERKAVHAYDAQPEAQAVGMSGEERSHARVFQALQQTTGKSLVGPVLAQLERRHRGTGGGNVLRAGVLGASDGLTSNLSLVMGVAGANLSGHAVLIAGFAGLLAGAFAMAIGEWLSVQSARELYRGQLAIERQELQELPEEEQEELALIYQAKGVDAETAHQLVRKLMEAGDTALDTLAREELGIDPEELGGSAWAAAITSFFLFALGAIVPVLPFVFGSGLVAIVSSLLLSALGLFIIGLGVTLTTGASLLKAGGRQVALGLLAALVTFGLGRLAGGVLG